MKKLNRITIDKLKSRLKRSEPILKIYNRFVQKEIINVNKCSNKSKRALLSYSVYPFKDKIKKMIHPNYIESYKLNKLLDEYGYTVDIYNNIYSGNISYDKYDLIIGEGLPISNYFNSKTKKRVKTIYYATGSHPIFNNIQSYKALIKFYNKSGKWLSNSSRIVNTDWFLGASLSDYFIIIGNEITKKSFKEYNDKSDMYTINPPFYKSIKSLNCNKKSKDKFLWFGSYGLIHKGLDVVIETFMKRPDMELHVCGYLDNESDFVNYYKPLLKNHDNIHLHGFVNIESNQFNELMETCSFVVLTSQSEGLATAVVTAMGNGGLIPIVTKETGIDQNLGIEVYNNNIESLDKAINISQLLSEKDIIEKTLFNIKYIEDYFNEDYFESSLRNIFNKILNGGKK